MKKARVSLFACMLIVSATRDSRMSSSPKPNRSPCRGDVGCHEPDRREARANAGERLERAESYHRLAAEAHQQIRELGQCGRHLYPWFERHKNVLALGLAAEAELTRPHRAAYHVLGARASRRSPLPS